MKLYMWLETDQEKELKMANGYSVTLPITISKTLDESLDFGHFQLRTKDSEPIVPFTKCKIIDDNNITTYWYAYSTVTSINLNEDRWLHDVILIEPTKILERHILGARAFSSGSSYFTTNEQLINLILETCYPTREGDVNPLAHITFNNNGREEFQETAREYFFPENTTLFEAFEAIGKSINAFPRMIDFHTLTFDFFNDTTQADISTLKKFEESRTYNIDQYCGCLQSIVNNAIDLNNCEIVPDNHNGITVRSDTVRLTVDTGKIILPKPIYKIKKVEILSGITAQSTKKKYDFVRPVDITEYVYEKSEWDLLTPNGKKKGGQYCSLFYTSGQKTIENIFDYGKNFLGIPGGYSLSNILKDFLTPEIEKPYMLAYYTGVTDLEGAKWEQEILIDVSVNIKFRISYIPLDKIMAKNYKTNLINNDYNNTLIFNPSANIININYYGQNLKATADKLGNKEMSLSFRTNTHILPNVGEKIGDYFISKIDSEYYREYSKVKIELVKEYNKINENVGIDSQLRLYAIPDDSYVTERIIHLDTFCYVDSHNELNINSDLTDKAKKYIMDTLAADRDFTKFEKIDLVNYHPKLDDNSSVLEINLAQSLSAYSLGNSILFSFGFHDNSIAGYYKEEDYNKAIRYTNEKGELKEIIIEMKYNKTDYDPSTYPKIHLGCSEKTVNVFTLHINNIKKDSRDILKFNYQIHFINRSEDVILSEIFSNSCSLIYNKTSFPTLGKSDLFVKFCSNNIDFLLNEIEVLEEERLYFGLIDSDDNINHGYLGNSKNPKVKTTTVENYIKINCNSEILNNYKSLIIYNHEGNTIMAINNIKEEQFIYFNFSNLYN